MHIVIVSLIFRLLKIVAYLQSDNIGTDNGGREESSKHGVEESNICQTGKGFPCNFKYIILPTHA